MPGPTLYPAPAEIEGLPTQAELDALPRLNTWQDIKDIIASHEPPTRHPAIQARYDAWYPSAVARFGSIEDMLVNVRLPWKDRPVLERRTAKKGTHAGAKAMTLQPAPDPWAVKVEGGDWAAHVAANPPPAGLLRYQTGDKDNGALDPEEYAFLPSDWPHDVPLGVRHIIVWTRKTLFHPTQAPSFERWSEIHHEGYHGFTGTDAPTEYDEHGRRVGDWVTQGGEDIDRLVRDLWPVGEFECVWYANPLRFMSVRGISHFHVLVRAKTETGGGEEAQVLPTTPLE